MGAVALGSQACVAVLEGRKLANERDLARFLLGDDGTPNQRYMVGAAALSALDVEIRNAARVEVAARLNTEELGGPCWWEVCCPDPHGGMYALAWVTVMAQGARAPAGSPLRELGRRAAVILGQQLRLGDLVATPDGDLRGLPGMRAPNGAGLSRQALSACWIETRSRQGLKVVHRGTGGRPRKLVWTPTSDALIDGPACFLQRLLDAPGGRDLLAGPLSPAAALPARLRLPLTVYRWNGGTLAYFADPGLEHRREYVIEGSAAAKRDADHDEDPATWVMVEWGQPARHHVTAGETWETAPPTPPAGARQTFISGA